MTTHTSDVADLPEALTEYLEAQDALDNREYEGINAEPYEKLVRSRNHARAALESALAAGQATAAQPAAQGVAYAALPDERAAFEAWYIAQVRSKTSTTNDWSDDEIRGAWLSRPSEEYRSYFAGQSWEAWQARASRAPADSAPAWASQAVIEYRYTGGTHWCPLGPTERMKPNFGGVYRLQGGVFPVEAPADSVTAPAGGVDDEVDAIALARYKVVPAHESMFHRFAVLAGDGKRQLYLGREIECANMARKFAGAFLDGAFYQANIAPTPPAQAADSVLEDAARYRWLREGNDAKHGAAWHVAVNLYGFEWDAAIDAAMNKGGSA